MIAVRLRDGDPLHQGVVVAHPRGFLLLWCRLLEPNFLSRQGLYHAARCYRKSRAVQSGVYTSRAG